MMYTFTVPGQPKGKGRPRFSIISGHTRVYTPEATREYEDLIRKRALDAGCPMIPKGKAVGVRIMMFYAIPASWSKERKRAAAGGHMYPVVKPDLDNVVKTVLDSLNHVTWHDDNQIVKQQAEKAYGDVPRIIVQYWEVEDINTEEAEEQ